jgi:hypothetical protein
MTVRSAANAIATILKVECFSGRTADLRMFLRSRCKLVVVRVALRSVDLGVVMLQRNNNT